MRGLASISISITFLGAMTACGGSSSHPDASAADAHVGPDAPPPDATTPFGCLGLPLPTTAPATVTVSGKTEEIKNLATQGLGGVAVKAFKSSGGAAIASLTSGTDGTYAISIPTGGTPLDGYVMGHHDPVGSSTYLDTYLYPPHALVGDSDQGVILMLTSDTLGLLTGVAGVTQDPAKGMIGMVVADCNGMPLAGAKVTTEPMGTVVYDSGSLPSSSATMTDTDGRAYVFNVTAGSVVVHAKVGSMDLRAVTLDARAGVVTTCAIEP